MKYPEPESSTVEFKQELPKNDQIIKTIIGFCNQNGGKIIVGVKNDGTIIGLSELDLEKALEYLDKSIYEASCPPIIPLIYAQYIGDKLLLIIQVSSGMNKPYFVRSEGMERGTYIRLGRSTMRATTDIIQELQWTSRGKTFDSMPVHNANIEDLALEKIDLFFGSRKYNVKIPNNFTEALQSYNLIINEHSKDYPTVAGILLFGKNPQRFFTEAMIICTKIAGIEGRNVIATRDCMGTLVEQFHEAYNFILSQLNRSFIIKGPRRIEQLEVPEIAIREALVNAIVHRNYNINGPIKIAIFDNRIEIFSPGSFPGPINTKNLQQGFTYIRNIAITKVFREMGYIEKLGTGFITIFSSYQKRKLKEPEVIEGENFIKYVLPRPTPSHLPINLADDYKKIINLFELGTEITVGDIIETLHIPRATASRKLAALVKNGILIKKGIGRGSTYSLKS